MRFRSVRNRIIVFFVALLGLVQLAAFVVVSYANSRNAELKIDAELAVGERIFERLLADNLERLSTAARVLAADFAFREAVASRDRETIESALDNHGARIHADLATLAALDGSIVASTDPRFGAGDRFPLPSLLDTARRDGSAAAVEILPGGGAYQVVIVPVLAPLRAGWVALGFRVDDALARDLERLSALDVSFYRHRPGERWVPLASTVGGEARDRVIAALGAAHEPAALVRVGAGRDEQQLKVLEVARRDDSRVVAVLQRSVAEATYAFERLTRALLLIGVASLVLILLGSMLLARSLTRPLDALGAAARRIRAGDYDTPVRIPRRDELGALAGHLDHMRTGIADRERQILRLAYRDTLTELPNRALFNDRLTHALENARRGGTPVAILLMDLDRFKAVNEALGHGAGDFVLREVAVRLGALLREADTVARLGGDEFAVLLERVDVERLPGVARKIHAALEAPIVFEGQPVDVGASIGIAHHPAHGETAEVLLRHADVAMYAAKSAKSGYALFDPDYDMHQQQHLSLLGELRRALERDELRVFYQPKLTLADERIGSVEALLRWEHPERGLVPPGEFVPFAEHTGYIKALTAWILDAAIRQSGEWRRAGRPLGISVNISTRDLANRELPERIAAALARHGADPASLCLEITESGFMDDPTHALEVLERLRALGLRLSIDDYGTGFSSLSYIARLPVQELKIDRSFVQGMATDATLRAIVRSTIELGHNLGLKVVAEGVESAGDVAMLRDFGCDDVQGYWLSRPLAPAALCRFLEEREAATVG